MARPMTPAAMALRSEVISTVQAVIDAGNVPDRMAMAKTFVPRGALTTILRWIDGYVAARASSLVGAPSTASVSISGAAAPVVGRELVVRDMGGEPRILDTDLGQRLGYSRPRDIRPLIPAGRTVDSNVNRPDAERYGSPFPNK
jgi:hypothetical protein